MNMTIKTINKTNSHKVNKTLAFCLCSSNEYHAKLHFEGVCGTSKSKNEAVHSVLFYNSLWWTKSCNV